MVNYYETILASQEARQMDMGRRRPIDSRIVAKFNATLWIKGRRRMSKQCKLCLKWYHYKADHDVCDPCYQKFKWMEIYGRPNKDFCWGEEE